MPTRLRNETETQKRVFGSSGNDNGSAHHIAGLNLIFTLYDVICNSDSPSMLPCPRHEPPSSDCTAPKAAQGIFNHGNTRLIWVFCGGQPHLSRSTHFRKPWMSVSPGPVGARSTCGMPDQRSSIESEPALGIAPWGTPRLFTVDPDITVDPISDSQSI